MYLTPTTSFMRGECALRGGWGRVPRFSTFRVGSERRWFHRRSSSWGGTLLLYGTTAEVASKKIGNKLKEWWAAGSRPFGWPEESTLTHYSNSKSSIHQRVLEEVGCNPQVYSRKGNRR